MHANHLHLLIPFALPVAGNAPALLRDLELPALEKLLQRATLLESDAGAAFQRTLPHERWLARRFGLIDALDTPDAAPLAAHMLLADGGTPGDASWACVEPVHIRIARDHLVLIDPATLAIEPEEAARLLADARPLIEEMGIRLEAPNPLRWYLSGAALGRLASAPPLRAAGRSVEIWLPQAEPDADPTAPTNQDGEKSARQGKHKPSRRSPFWMKLQNEVQMRWFEHPINEAREARGALPANSIWLHSQGALPAHPAPTPYAIVYAGAPAPRGLALASGATLLEVPVALPDGLGQAGGGTADPAAAALAVLDALALPFVHEDWYAWRQALSDIETQWLQPALAALEQGALRSVTLTLCGETDHATLRTTRADLRKFWRRRTFSALLPASHGAPDTPLPR